MRSYEQSFLSYSDEDSSTLWRRTDVTHVGGEHWIQYLVIFKRDSWLEFSLLRQHVSTVLSFEGRHHTFIEFKDTHRSFMKDLYILLFESCYVATRLTAAENYSLVRSTQSFQLLVFTFTFHIILHVHLLQIQVCRCKSNKQYAHRHYTTLHMTQITLWQE